MRYLLIRRWRLPYKLILVYTPLIIVPVVVGLYYLTYNYNNLNKQTVSDYSQELLKITAEKIDARITRYNEISKQIFADAELRTYIQEEPTSNFAIVLQQKMIEDRINQLINGEDRKYVRAVVLQSLSGMRYTVGEDDLHHYFDDDKEFKSTIVSGQGSANWFLPRPFQTPTASFEGFRLSRLIRNEDLQPLGYLYLVIDTHMVTDIFDSMLYHETTALELTDLQGHSIVSNGVDAATLRADSLYAESPLIAGKWKVIARLPLTRMHMMMNQMGQLTAWIVIICTVIGLVATYMIAIDVMVPIRRLMQNMKQGIKGVSPSSLRKFKGAIEIVELNDTFISVMYNIHHLMHENTTNQAKKRAAELKVLQNQLSPHFLYNTLNSIRWMALIQKQDHIRSMVESLTQLLTYAIRDGREMVTVEQEITMLQHYVGIQQVRYQNFRFDVDMEDDVLGALILKFLLQPLIENALIHGLATVEHRGVVTVQFRRKAQQLIAIVSDNGKGISKERLEELQSDLYASRFPTAHIGMRNVRERIQMHFGIDYELSVESNGSSGTQITVTMPYMTEEEVKE